MTPSPLSAPTTPSPTTRHPGAQPKMQIHDVEPGTVEVDVVDAALQVHSPFSPEGKS